MNIFRVTFEDGNTLVTSMNATLKEAKAYYIGHRFNFGDSDNNMRDKMIEAVWVEQLN